MPLRRTPLRRKTPLRTVSKTNSYRKRTRDPDFMAFVAWCPCALKDEGGCKGRVEVDHAGAHPKGWRSADDATIPLCTHHHRARTDYRGYFKNWTGNQMRAWCDQQIAFYQRLYKNLVNMGRAPWRKRWSK